MSFKTSLQPDLDRFYKSVSNSDFNIREVSKGALTQARSKLNAWAFKRLNEVAVKRFYEQASYYVWYGMRVLAIDGSRLSLPNHHSIKEAFGVHHFGPKADSPRSLALISLLYDVVNHLTLDAEIAPYGESEKDLLLLDLEKVEKGDLLLLDRGYPCFWLLFLLKAKGIQFCVRLKQDWWLQVQDFTKSTDQERIVKFSLAKKDPDKLGEYPHMVEKQISCRLIKVVLDNGDVEVLCTSLVDKIEYKLQAFKWLYHYRWNEEEAYKLLKSRMELEAFSGKTAKAVKQVFLMTLTAAYAHPIEEKLRAEHQADKDRKHPQKINKTSAVALVMDRVIPIFIKRKWKQALQAFDQMVYRTRELIRPARNKPRKKRPKKQ